MKQKKKTSLLDSDTESVKDEEPVKVKFEPFAQLLNDPNVKVTIGGHSLDEYKNNPSLLIEQFKFVMENPTSLEKLISISNNDMTIEDVVEKANQGSSIDI